MEECSRLWEVIWAKGFHCNLKIELPVASSSSSGYSGEKDVAEDDAMKLNQHKEWDFVYFFALAVFERSEEELKSKCSAFDELLKFSNELSCRISLDTILERAEALRLRFRVKAASVTDSFSSSTDLLSVLNKIESLSKV